jgi:hypothetical protein
MEKYGLLLPKHFLTSAVAKPSLLQVSFKFQKWFDVDVLSFQTEL